MSEWYSKHTKKDLSDRIEQLEDKLAASYTRAQIEAAVKRALEAAAAEAAGEVAAHGCAEFAPFMRRRIRAITPADASAALRAQIEAAVKRALEGAAEVCSTIIQDYDVMDSTGTKYLPLKTQKAAKSMVSLAREDIRALDPAHFIDGDKQ